MIDFPSASSPSELKFEPFKRKGNIEEEENKYNKNSCCTSPDKVRFYLRNDDDLFYKDRTTSIAKKNNLILRLTMNVITNFGYKTVRQKKIRVISTIFEHDRFRIPRSQPRFRPRVV